MVSDTVVYSPALILITPLQLCIEAAPTFTTNHNIKYIDPVVSSKQNQYHIRLLINMRRVLMTFHNIDRDKNVKFGLPSEP